MRRRGFTLVELLTVMAILSILYAIAVPAIVAAKGAVGSMVSLNGLKQLGQVTQMYAADNEDTAPLAMYNGPNGLITWFGSQVEPTSTSFDPKGATLAAYIKGHVSYDPTFKGEPWKGDQAGYGYNWGYIGSDFNMQPMYVNFPNCQNAAAFSQLASPADTILYATSSFFSAPWLVGGNSQTYQFNFIDPPRLWNGNPDVDFRIQGVKKVDPKGRTVTSTGHANVVRCDGSAKAKAFGAVTDSLFTRDGQAN